jgi:hypothetical protein
MKPVGQDVQLPDPAVLYVFTPQVEQVLLPVPDAYCPARHEEHDVAPVKEDAEPAAHDVQDVRIPSAAA